MSHSTFGVAHVIFRGLRFDSLHERQVSTFDNQLENDALPPPFAPFHPVFLQ